MKKKALIISLKGTRLTSKEMSLLTKENPWGVILFKRNLKSVDQIKLLTSKIKRLTMDKNFPILIDEEGETVSRLSSIINQSISANFFGNLFKNDSILCLNLYRLYINSLNEILPHSV